MGDRPLITPLLTPLPQPPGKLHPLIYRQKIRLIPWGQSGANWTQLGHIINIVRDKEEFERIHHEVLMDWLKNSGTKLIFMFKVTSKLQQLGCLCFSLNPFTQNIVKVNGLLHLVPSIVRESIWKIRTSLKQIKEKQTNSKHHQKREASLKE